MRGRMVLAGVALTLLAAPAGAAAKGSPCAAHGTHTVFRTEQARVFTAFAHHRLRYYGCLESTGRAVRIARAPTGPRAAQYLFTLPAVRGRYLGFVERRGGRRERVSVVNLRNGRVKFRSKDTKGPGPAGAWTTTALVVTRHGDAAWIDRYAYSDQVTEVHAHDRRGDVLLDRGPIHAHFLLAHGERIVWARDDGSLRARLRP